MLYVPTHGVSDKLANGFLTCAWEHLAQDDVSHAFGTISELKAQYDRLLAGMRHHCLSRESLDDRTSIPHLNGPISHLDVRETNSSRAIRALHANYGQKVVYKWEWTAIARHLHFYRPGQQCLMNSLNSSICDSLFLQI